MFNLSNEEVNERNAVHTALEIHQQPDVWQELVTTLFQQKEILNGFMESIYTKHEQVRVLLTGAGTSAFIGDTIAPTLNRQSKDNIQFEGIATTDVVSNPKEYLFADIPTIMVSFARSGNSPESLATVALGQKIIKDFYQVVITCNKEGQLAKNIQHDDNSITVLMPEKSNDKSLAMTSSFSCMMIAAYQIFSSKPITTEGMKQVIANGETMVDTVSTPVDDILTFDFDRIVYLGSGPLAQLAHEASLKMLELSAGKVVALHESSLGFRHGPKSILNEKSAVVIFMSQDPYTRKYDMDILQELTAGDSGMKVIALSEKKDEIVEQLADWTIPVNDSDVELQNDFSLSMLYIIFAQVLAMKKSLQLDITPDNPSPTGAISRVVQGVTIHEYEG